MSKREELIKKLRAVQLEMFRNAAALDRAITSVELSLDESYEEEYIRLFIRQQVLYREHTIRVRGYDKLLDQEKELWQQLSEVKEES